MAAIIVTPPDVSQPHLQRLRLLSLRLGIAAELLRVRTERQGITGRQTRINVATEFAELSGSNIANQPQNDADIIPNANITSTRRLIERNTNKWRELW